MKKKNTLKTVKKFKREYKYKGYGTVAVICLAGKCEVTICCSNYIHEWCIYLKNNSLNNNNIIEICKFCKFCWVEMGAPERLIKKIEKARKERRQSRKESRATLVNSKRNLILEETKKGV